MLEKTVWESKALRTMVLRPSESGSARKTTGSARFRIDLASRSV